VTSKGLIEIVQRLNQGVDGLGNPLAEPTGFWVGVAGNGTPEDLDQELTRLKVKLKAGAGFIITQPVFDLTSFRKFLGCIKPFKIPVFAGIMPLTSLRQAEYLENEVPGIKIPMAIKNELKRAIGNETKVGIAITRDLINQLKDLVNGICLMLPKAKYQLLAEILAK
jgi:homocysteine S-methyltransferase